MSTSIHSWLETAEAPDADPLAASTGFASGPHPDRTAKRLIDTFPYQAVVDEYLEVGKHFVDPGTLTDLAHVREVIRSHAHAEPARRLLRFLDVALDKHDGCYDYRTYLALPLLPMPCGPGYVNCVDTAALQRDRLLIHLLGDLLRFELASFKGPAAPLPQMRADEMLLDKRCRLALLALEPSLGRMGWDIASHETKAHAEHPLELAEQLSRRIEEHFSADERALLRLTMLPVYTLHDEYLFLRVLQSFETVFAYLCSALESAIVAIDDADVEAAMAHLASCSASLHDAAPMFSLLGTMRPEAFKVFRQYTEGASAIQSRGYKTMEALCGRPSDERLDSLGYRSVPEVRDRVLLGSPSVQEAVDHAREYGLVSPGNLERLQECMRGFEERVLLWRKTHHSLAVRMLGASSGTGYTEGTPYLKAVMDAPLFKAGASEPDGQPTSPGD